MGVSDGHSGRMIYHLYKSTAEFDTNLKTVVENGTFNALGEVLDIGVYMHPTTRALNNPLIALKSATTGEYITTTDVSNGNKYTIPLTITGNIKAIGCLSSWVNPSNFIEGLFNFAYFDDDGYLKIKGYKRDETVYNMSYTNITDNAYRIKQTRSYGNNRVDRMDFCIETVDGQIIHYNFQSTAPYATPTAIYRCELGYGRDPTLTWDDGLSRYVLLYRKRGGLYRKEFTLDTTTGSYEILSDNYLCDGEYAYFINTNTKYAIAFNGGFSQTTQAAPQTY